MGEILQRMTSQGASFSVSKNIISKIMSDHPEDFIQFNTDHKILIENLFKEYAPPNYHLQFMYYYIYVQSSLSLIEKWKFYSLPEIDLVNIQALM